MISAYKGISNYDEFRSALSYTEDGEEIDASDASEDFPKEDEILYASYSGGSYEEDYRVIWKRDDKWFEAADGHCSCNGFGEFNPKEVTEAYVAMQLLHLMSRGY